MAKRLWQMEKKQMIQQSPYKPQTEWLLAEGNAIKYLCRHKQKGQIKDLEKAKHYIDMAIERDYS